MMPKAAANHAALLSSDAPSDMMRVPYLGIHVRWPFCLFGHVTPHRPIRDALDVHTSQFHVDLASELAKTKCGECPLYYLYLPESVVLQSYYTNYFTSVCILKTSYIP